MSLITERKFDITNNAVAGKKIKSSVFFAALFCFVILNLVFWIVDTRFVISAKTRNEYYFDFPGIKKLCLSKKSADKPQALLLGSSLFVHPLRMLDKRLGEQNGIKCSNLNCYHGTEHLNQKLRLSKLAFGDICNLAVGGAMVSDYYLLLNEYASSGKFPSLIIVDCAPRSFYDSGLTEAKDTPIFDYFFNERDFLTLGNLYLPSWSSRLQFLTKYYCPLHRHRRSLIDSINDPVRGLVSCALDRLPHCPSHLNKSVEQESKVSLGEYRRHYSGISTVAIESQMHFLDLLINLCNAKKAKLLVLNMPLSKSNKSLLEPDFYSCYRDRVQAAVHRGRGYFADLDASGNYVEADFDDSAHLGLSGGEKLEDQFVGFIKGEDIVATDFSNGS